MKQNNRYMFTVRQRFQKEPTVDCFYEMKTPLGFTSDKAVMMEKLGSSVMMKIVKGDASAYQGMSMRLRFNQDCFQQVCMVNSEGAMDAEMLEDVIRGMSITGDLEGWLRESALG